MTLEEILKGLNCCSEFLCKECPYNQYASSNYILKCMHKLMVDLQKNLPSILTASDINTGEIYAYAFGKYKVKIKDIYDDFGSIWAKCETENKSTEEYLISDLKFECKKDLT